MTMPNPNGAAASPMPQPDLQRIANRAAQVTASSLGDVAVQCAMATELAELYAGRVQELDAELADVRADKARMGQAMRGLEDQVQELEAELAARVEADLAAANDEDVDAAQMTDAEREQRADGDTGETGEQPEGSAPGAD